MSNPDKQIGRYKIERKLGEGGMGDVYLGFDPTSEKLVAVKTIRRELVDNEKKLLRFKREIELQQKVKHPNVVQILDMGDHEGTQYIVLEYVEGQELGDVCPPGGMDISKAAHISERVCLAMHDVHELGIIHRDMKPANVLLDGLGNPHIIDFGVAKSLSTEDDVKLTRDGGFVGTLEYASPEQAEGRLSDVDRRSDIFNLGAMIYKLVTGRTPFYDPKRNDPNDMRMRIVRDHPIEPRRIRPEIPIDLERIILKSLAKDREKRYQTAKELGEDLAKFRAGERVKVAYSLKADKLSQWFSTHRTKVFAVTAFLVAVCGFSYYYVGKLAQERQEMLARVDALIDEHATTYKQEPVLATIAAYRVLLNFPKHADAVKVLVEVVPKAEHVDKELKAARAAFEHGDTPLASEHLAHAYALSPEIVTTAGFHYFDGRWLDTEQARKIGVLSPQNERKPGHFFFGQWLEEARAIQLGHLLKDAKRDLYVRGDEARELGWFHQNGEWLDPATTVAKGLLYYDETERRYYAPADARARGFTFENGRWLTAAESQKLGRGMMHEGRWLVADDAARAGYRHQGERWYHLSDMWVRSSAGMKVAAPEPVTAIAWGQRDKWFALGTATGKILLFEKLNAKEPATSITHGERPAGHRIVEMVFDSKDEFLLARDAVGMMCVYEVAGAKLVRRRDQQLGPEIHDMLVVGQDPLVFELAFRASSLLKVERFPQDTKSNRQFDIGEAYRQATWSYDGRDMLILAGGKLRHWDMAAFRTVKSDNGDVKIWGERIRDLPLPFKGEGELRLAFVPNAVVAVALQNELRLIDGRDGRVLAQRQMPGVITDLAFDLAGDSLIVTHRSPDDGDPQTVRGTKLQAGGVQ